MSACPHTHLCSLLYYFWVTPVNYLWAAALADSQIAIAGENTKAL